MAFSLVPSESYHSIYDIDIKVLQENKIALLLLDLDNTLIPYGKKDPNEELHQWVKALQTAGIAPFILSNSRKPTRVKRFATALDIPFLGWSGKPKKTGFLKAMAMMGAKKAETAMVGDQIFTDILGANRAGILSIVVEPIQKDTAFRHLRYNIEKPFRRKTKKKH